MRVLIIMALGLALGAAQHIAVKAPTEPAATPVSKPERRRALSISPEAIFDGLLNSSVEARKAALRELGKRAEDFGSDSEIDDVRLARINLDGDEDLEAVLTYTSGRKVTTAVVFDRSGGRWWQVGQFEYWWHWNSEQAEHLLQFREIVWPGRKDLLVRSQTGGAGAGSTDLLIYRLHEGRLYRVIQITEEAYDMTGNEQRRISYEDVQSGHPTIIVEGTKIIDDKRSGAGKSRPTTCEAYRWDARQFAFQIDKAAMVKLCPGRVR